MPSASLPQRRGHFLLESGLHGDVWIDLDGLIADSARLRPLAYALADELPVWQLEAILGPREGGAVVAALVGEATGLPAFAAERTVDAAGVHYTIPDQAASALKGKRVAIVDDVIGGGSAVKATLRAALGAGIQPIVLGALYESAYAKGRLPAEAGLPVQSLGVVEGGLWSPAECPLCRAKVPLEVPGAIP